VSKKRGRAKTKRSVKRRGLTHTKLVEQVRNFLANKYQKDYSKRDLEVKTEVGLEKGRADIVLSAYKRGLIDHAKSAFRWWFSDKSLKEEFKERPPTPERVIICEVKTKTSSWRAGLGQVLDYKNRSVQSNWVKDKEDVDAYLAFPEEEYRNIDEETKTSLKEQKVGTIVCYKSGRVRILTKP